MDKGWVGPLGKIAKKTQDIDDEQFKREYMRNYVEVNELRLNDMFKQNLRLNDRIGEYALAKIALQADNKDLRKENEELIKENQELRIVVEKIHSRYDILDL